MQGSEHFRDWFYQIHGSEEDKPVVTLDCNVATLLQQVEALVEAAYCAGYTKGMEALDDRDYE